MIFMTQKQQRLIRISLLFSLGTVINGCGLSGKVAKECNSKRLNAEEECCPGFVCNFKTHKCIAEHRSEIKTTTEKKPAAKKTAAKKTKSTLKSTNTKFLNATYTTDSISITVESDGTVSLVRTDTNEVVSTSKTTGWSIYNNYEKKRTTLNKMETTGDNEMLLSTSDGKYKVKVHMIEKERYIKFKLIHVSNNPETGGLDNDWPGNRVEFDVHTQRQRDGWKLNTLILNPMSELKGRSPYRNDNGINFNWPYPQYNQTDKHPQPQGAVAAFGYIEGNSGKDIEKHDDIIKDIWVSEESLPRPNRKNYMTSWTREDIDAYLVKWQARVEKAARALDFHPHGEYQNLYYAADLAYKYQFNAIYLHQNIWQGYDMGSFNEKLFPNGQEDALPWKAYCTDRGIRTFLRGFAGPINKASPTYGRGAVADGLAKSAAGTLLEDVPADALGYTFLVEPDLDFYPGIKEWMLPFYDVDTLRNISRTNGGLGTHRPPYYESLSSRISLDRNLYKYTATITSDFKWKIKISKNARDRTSTTPLVNHIKGSRVEFILMSKNGQYFTPGSRSDMLVEMATTYAETLNLMEAGSGYDGAAYLEDMGSWGLRRLSQVIWEGLDHPTTTDSSFGIKPFGHFEYQFKKARQRVDRHRSMPMFTATQAVLAPSTDMSNQGAGAGAKSEDVTIRSIHEGVDISIIEGYGLTDNIFKLANLWSDIKALLSSNLKSSIANNKNDFYAATEVLDQIMLTKTRAIRRPLIDEAWNRQPERPDIAPRQFLKANGKVLVGLENPYEDQTPVVEINVMADMSHEYTDNISLMPANANSIINPRGAEQTLDFTDNKLTVSVDNSNSNKDYIYYARRDTVGYWMRKIDMSLSRGVAITLNGDGSGSTLVVSTGGLNRMYTVDIDFVGEKTIDIPNGEVCNNRYGWDVFKAGSVTSFKYEKVDRFRVFLQKVPAATMSVIEVTNIVALKEHRSTGLINPIISLNDQSVTVEGIIPYGHYLVYSGGDAARLYDKNWFGLEQTLPVISGVTLTALNGADNSFSVNAENSSNTWLSTRIKVQDKQNVIVIEKPIDVQKKVD